MAGNLSLNQEIGFITKVNQWLAEGKLSSSSKKPIQLEQITMSAGLSGALDYASKLNRDAKFIARLMADGERRAGEFLSLRGTRGGIARERPRLKRGRRPGTMMVDCFCVSATACGTRVFLLWWNRKCGRVEWCKRHWPRSCRLTRYGSEDLASAMSLIDHAARAGCGLRRWLEQWA